MWRWKSRKDRSEILKGGFQKAALHANYKKSEADLEMLGLALQRSRQSSSTGERKTGSTSC
ncbi:hypothetical protein XI25_11700 [Paenibacillus sp. DMB20]|nr:hypothetical protein XI25_11700 [Paenibacillus sp. DMB20]